MGIELHPVNPPARAASIEEVVMRHVRGIDPRARLTLLDQNASGGEVCLRARGVLDAPGLAPDAREWMLCGVVRRSGSEPLLELYLAAWCPGQGMAAPERLDPVRPPVRGVTPEEAVSNLVQRTYGDAHLTVVERTPRDGAILIRVQGTLSGPNVDRDEREWHVTSLVRPAAGGFELVASTWGG